MGKASQGSDAGVPAQAALDPEDPAIAPAVAAAMDVLDRFMTAINTRDTEALLGVLHFPHYRLSQGEMKIWQDTGSYMRDFEARAGADWHDSVWLRRAVVGASPDKVHVNVEFARRRRDGGEIARYRSLWVITRQDGVWRTALRSSFAN